VVDDYALRQQKKENENPDVPAANASNVHCVPGTAIAGGGIQDGNDKQQSRKQRQRHRCEKKFLPDREFSRFRHRALPLSRDFPYGLFQFTWFGFLVMLVEKDSDNQTGTGCLAFLLFGGVFLFIIGLCGGAIF
jgi:hypothetical protein